MKKAIQLSSLTKSASSWSLELLSLNIGSWWNRRGMEMHTSSKWIILFQNKSLVSSLKSLNTMPCFGTVVSAIRTPRTWIVLPKTRLCVDFLQRLYHFWKICGVCLRQTSSHAPFSKDYQLNQQGSSDVAYWFIWSGQHSQHQHEFLLSGCDRWLLAVYICFLIIQQEKNCWSDQKVHRDDWESNKWESESAHNW